MRQAARLRHPADRARARSTRLRAIADVKVNPDSSRIIAKTTLIAAVRKCDILFSLLHDKIDRAVLAANPKLRAIASHVDHAGQYRRGRSDQARHSGHRGAADRGRGDRRHQFRADARGGAPHGRRRPPGARRQIPRLAVGPSRRRGRLRQDHRPGRRRRAHRPGDGAARARLRHARALLGPAAQAGGRARGPDGLCARSTELLRGIRFRLAASAAQRRDAAHDRRARIRADEADRVPHQHRARRRSSTRRRWCAR